jgi:hypothetical protein
MLSEPGVRCSVRRRISRGGSRRGALRCALRSLALRSLGQRSGAARPWEGRTARPGPARPAAPASPHLHVLEDLDRHLLAAVAALVQVAEAAAGHLGVDLQLADVDLPVVWRRSARSPLPALQGRAKWRGGGRCAVGRLHTQERSPGGGLVPGGVRGKVQRGRGMPGATAPTGQRWSTPTRQLRTPPPWICAAAAAPHMPCLLPSAPAPATHLRQR